MRVSILAIGLALAAAPALANEGTVTEPAADADKVVCKYQQRTGTKFPKKICLTKAQWAQMAEETRSLLQGVTGTVGNNGRAPVERPIFPNGQ